MPGQSTIRSTFKHASIYLTATLLQRATGFLLIPLYAKYLGADGYGIIGMIDVVVSFLTVSIGFGITGAMRRFYFTKITEQEKAIFISTGVLLMSFLVVMVSFFGIFFSKYIAAILLGNNVNGWYYILLAILTFSADMTATSASCFILIKEQSKLYGILSFSKFLVGLTFNIYFIVYLKLDVLGLLYSNLIAGVLFSIFVHAYVLKRVGIGYCRSDAKEILSYSLPLIPGSFAMLVRNDADKVILRTFMGLSELGTYVMLQKFSSLLIELILQPFQNIWNVKQFEICDKEDGPYIIAKIFTLQLTLMLFFGLILSVEIPLILKVLTPQEFWIPGIFAFLAVISRILFSVYYTVSFGLSYAKLTKQISILQITTAILSVILNSIAIKLFGLLGALISSCIVYSTQCVIAHLLSKKHYHIPYELRKIVWLTLISTLLYFAIESFTLSYLGISINKISCQAIIADIMNVMHLSFLINSKIIGLFLENMNLILDAFIKLVLCCSFIIAVLFLGIIKKENIYEPVYALMNRFGFKSTK